METNGRKIEPTLCHGDAWQGNWGVDNNTDEPVIYDPCAVYAHNECEKHICAAGE
jgi:protein-ribulosamine 3-kinase